MVTIWKKLFKRKLLSGKGLSKEEQERSWDDLNRRIEAERSKREELKKKVLTISALEYCTTNHKELSNYEVQGVHFSGYSEGGKPGLIKFIENLPTNTEVVVSFHQVGHNLASSDYRYYYLACGTALIPKQGARK